MKSTDRESGVTTTLDPADDPLAAAAGLDDSNPPVQLDELLDRCMGNVHLATRLIHKCQECFDEELGDLLSRNENSDAEEIARIAHRLKGAAASLSATELCRLFSKIEEHGRSQDLAELPQCLECLQTEWKRFVSYTNAFVERVSK